MIYMKASNVHLTLITTNEEGVDETDRLLGLLKAKYPSLYSMVYKID